MSGTTVRTNIFGDLTTHSSIGTPGFSTLETTAAGKLIDKLKFIADEEINNVGAAVDWLGIAANAGQNESAEGLVKKQLVKPDKLTSANILSGWINPPMPTLPTFPILPDNLRIDMSAFKVSLDTEVTRLKNSWLAQAIPTTPTDLSRFDDFIRDVLNGSDDISVKSQLTSLETALQTALANISGPALNDLVASIATAKANLATNTSGLQPKIDAALAVAQDDTQDIAWARARDQAAREAARLELESVEEYAARGFSLPGGALTATAAMARQATLDVAGRVAGDQAVRAQEQYLDIAKIAVTSWIQTAEFQLKADITGFTAYMDQRLKYAAMDMENNRAKVKQAVEHLGLRIDFTKFAGDMAMKYRLGVADSMNGLINAYANLAGTEMQYLARIAEAQRANLQSLIEYFRTSIAYSEMGMRASITNNENDIRWAQIAAQFIGAAVGHHVQAASTTADAYARVAGMAMSGLNGVASVSASG
jgi:hypothetical protein